jgi:hypothetical protein
VPRLRILFGLLLALGSCKEHGEARLSKRVKRSTTTASAPTPAAPFESRALALAWTGFATLPFDAQRLRRDHTLFVRFMPAYEGGYRGVLVSDKSGSYRVGLAPYASLNQPAVEVSLGNRTVTAPLPEPILSTLDVASRERSRWLSLAVTLRGSEAKLYVNGILTGAVELEARDFEGDLWLGRLSRSLGTQDQFYGLIEDVALFERPLTEPELLALARTPRLSPKLDGLLSIAMFDAGDPDRIQLQPRLNGAAALVRVSMNRDADADRALLPSPSGPERFELPFAKDQIWIVIQGTNSAETHHDTAAFALDFQRVDPSLAAHNPERKPGASAAQSENQIFFAPADGRVVSLVDCFREDGSGCDRKAMRALDGEGAKRNLLCLEHAAGVVSCYLHLKKAFVRRGARVRRGDALGVVGRTGTARAHLHVALSDLPEPNEPGAFSDLTTIPFVFRDYEASSDFGRSWERVEAGTPRVYQWVRRAH